MNLRRILPLALIPLSPLPAQVLYSTPGVPYVQDFAHPDAGTEIVPWIDNETYRGWFAAFHDGKREMFETPDAVLPTTGLGRGDIAFYLYRSASAPADLALGAQPSDERCPGFGTGGVFYGVQVVNATDRTLRALTLSYRVEQYRVAATPDKQTTLTVGHRVGGEGLSGGNWTVFPRSIYTTPVVGEGEGTGAKTIDGNAPAHLVEFEDLRVEGLALAPGQSIWLRWFDVNNRSADHGVGIDDVRITLVP